MTETRPSPALSPSFASFWAADTLSAYELACLSSILHRGCALHLYSYGPIRNAPEGAQVHDAREVVDEHFVHGFLIKGKPSLSHFSDLFRYRLFQSTPHVWIDADMVMRKPLDFPLPPLFVAREDPGNLCGAIMRIDGGHAQLPTLIRITEEVAKRELAWGETGPRLLTRVFGTGTLAGALPAEKFYPLHYTEFWKAFLPECREECEAACRDAYTVHLWNSVVGHLGIWKRFMPPHGSYLGEYFRADGTDRFFEDAYPAPIMRQMVDNWRRRMDGAELSLGQLARQVVPGLKLTVERRREMLRLSRRRV